MYQVSLKSEGGRPFFVITWPGITHSPVGEMAKEKLSEAQEYEALIIMQQLYY